MVQLASALLLLGGCRGGGASAPEGVRVLYRLDGAITTPETFYDHPFPSDQRLGSAGPDFSGMTRPNQAAVDDPLDALAEAHEGWSTVPVVYFRFDGPVRAPAIGDPIGAADIDPHVAFIDLSADAPAEGAVIEAVAHVLPVDTWVTENILAITPAPGQVLRPGTPYATIVRRDFGDASGAPLGVNEVLFDALRDRAPDVDDPDALLAYFAPLRAALEAREISADDVAAATLFTTARPVARVAERYEDVLDRFAPELRELGHAPRDDEAEARFCVVEGVVRLPQFQRGTPPFDTEGELAFEDGVLVAQRHDDVPFTLAIPKGPMPEEGYPLVFYAHGTNGLAAQVVDRGPVLEPDGPRTPGLGPAHVLARHGIASAGLAVLLGPERLNGIDRAQAYLNIGNLRAYPATFQQAGFDIGLFLDLLEEVEIPDAELGACAEGTEGDAPARFAVSRIGMMGQSAGAHLAAQVGALDPRVVATAPTGIGGYWSQLISTGAEVFGPSSIFALVFDARGPLTPLHPAANLLETAWLDADPLVYAPHVARWPLEGRPARHMYVPSAEADGFHPEPLYDALVTAYGLELADAPLWTSMGEALDAAGLTERPDTPVSGNRTGPDGESLTLVTTHWAGDGLADPHGVFAQRTEVKHQYGCFFADVFAGDMPTVPVPATEGSACE